MINESVLLPVTKRGKVLMRPVAKSMFRESAA